MCENERVARLKECLRWWQQGSKDSTNIIKCKCRRFTIIPGSTSQFSNTFSKPVLSGLFPFTTRLVPRRRSSAIFATCFPEIKISNLNARIFYMEHQPRSDTFNSVTSSHPYRTKFCRDRIVLRVKSSLKRSSIQSTEMSKFHSFYFNRFN